MSIRTAKRRKMRQGVITIWQRICNTVRVDIPKKPKQTFLIYDYSQRKVEKKNCLKMKNIH